MELFTLAAKLTADTKDFDKGVSGADKSGKRLASSLENAFSKVKKIIAATVSVVAVKKVTQGLFNLASATAAYGDQIDKQSQALGMSRKEYQEWDYVLGQNGASIESLGTSMKTLNAAITGGGKEASAAFKELGLSTKDLTALTQEQAFEMTIRAFQRLPAGAQKSALAVKLFGRQGQDLLPLLNSSSESIDELRKQAEELGIFMSDDAIDASVKWGDSLDALKRAWQGLKNTFGAQLLPIMTRGFDAVSSYIGRFNSRVKTAIATGDWKGLFDSVKGDILIAAGKIWDGIKSTVPNIAKMLFGETADGQIAWPTWDDVKDGALAAWNNIVANASALGEGFGKLIFGTSEAGGVNWPSWDDVKEAAKTAWNKIKTSAATLGAEFGKLIFGTTETGGVNWPTWEDVKKSARYAWNQIKVHAKYIADEAGALVFGRKEDGSVAYPEWKDVGETIRNAWDTIVEEAKTLGGFVLGNINDASASIDGIETKWEALKKTIGENTIDFFSGLTGKDPETVGATLKVISDALLSIGGAIATYSLVKNISSVITSIKGLFTGVSALNPTNIAISAIVGAGILIYQNWDGIQAFFEDLWNAVSSAVSDAWTEFTNWTGNILGSIKSAWNGVKGYLTGIWSSITGSIRNAISAVKEFLGLGSTAKQGPVFNSGTATAPGAGSGYGGGMPYNNFSGGSGGNYITPWRPYASGLNYVPYDGFLAELHRGETILNRSRADDYRNGSQNNLAAEFASFKQEMISAVRAGMEAANINMLLDGKEIARNTNRYMANDVKSRRFAAT